MNFGSSVQHIVVEPATDCCQYVQCNSSVSAESHVEQGGKGCVSVFWAA